MSGLAIMGLLLAQHAVCISSLLQRSAPSEQLEHKTHLGLATTQNLIKKNYTEHGPAESLGSKPIGGGVVDEFKREGPGHEIIDSLRSLGMDPHKNHQHHHLHVPEIALKIVAPACALFILVYVLAFQIERFELEWMPESLLTILIGLAFGFMMRLYLGHVAFFSDAEVSSLVNATLLNLVLLPIIIFESGWSIRYGDFISQFPYILLFAIIGTLISTASVASLVYGTGVFGLHRITSVRCCLCFASLISATDPVATLGTYSSMKVDPLLNIAVFGESVINDAVAIVLFNVFNSNDIMGDPKVAHTYERGEHSARMSHMFTRIIAVFFGSIFAGIFCGALLTIALRFAKMRDAPKMQVLFMLSSCYFTYALAEGIGMSGIISTLFCAFFMGVYTRPHMSTSGSLMTTVFIKEVAMMADTAVFVLVGIAAANVGYSGINFGMWMIPICLISRALAIFPMGAASNFVKNRRGKALNIPESGRHLFDFKTLFMMWHAGLRGGIALVLSMEIGHWANDLNGPGTKLLLQSATFVIIVFFLAVFGGTTSFTLKKMGIATGVDAPTDVLSKTEVSTECAERFYQLDRRFLQPLLVGTDADTVNASEFESIEEVFLDEAMSAPGKEVLSEEMKSTYKRNSIMMMSGQLPSYEGTPKSGSTRLSAHKADALMASISELK